MQLHYFIYLCRMNETKKRILDASRDLFNQYGVAKVSQRRISEQLGISPGNLTYHFKKSEDIVEALYFELVTILNQAMEELKSLNYDLHFMIKSINLMIDSFFDYRFILLDFVQIMRNHKKIRKHYEQLSVLRQQQWMEAVKQLTEGHMMRKEELPHEYDFLYERFHILADFWISSAEIKERAVEQKHLETYKKILIQMIYPYLTNEGKTVFLSIYK